MKKHTKIYMNALGYSETDFIPSELSGKKAVDIHHIIGRGKGGEDRIENLMALTREEHQEFGDKKFYMIYLLYEHAHFLKNKGSEYDKEYLLNKIMEYDNRH